MLDQLRRRLFGPAARPAPLPAPVVRPSEPDIYDKLIEDRELARRSRLRLVA